jgi:phosphoglycolate phosphatase
MQHFSTIIFDLDGTLSNPTVGIRNSFVYAFTKMRFDFDIDRHFSELIGPPLHSIFNSLSGWDSKDTEQAVLFFREYYGSKGIYENRIYDGIPELLASLRSAGNQLYVATSKFEKYALAVLHYHGIYQYFEKVAGAPYKGDGAGKSQLVESILITLPGIPLEEVVMVGDTKYDMQAAKDNELISVGVLYGFGSETELIESGAGSIVRSVRDLKELLLHFPGH